MSELCFVMAAEDSLGWWVHGMFSISERCEMVGANLADGRCAVHPAKGIMVDVTLAAEAGAALSAPGECFIMERVGVSGKKVFIQNGGIPCGITGEEDVWWLAEFAVRRWAQIHAKEAATDVERNGVSLVGNDGLSTTLGTWAGKDTDTEVFHLQFGVDGGSLALRPLGTL